MQQYQTVEAVTFNYGQRHALEIHAAGIITDELGVKHHIIDVPKVLKGSSPIIDKSINVDTYTSADVLPGGLEATFVPGRNLLFLTLASNLAYNIGAKVLYTGVCEEDYGGYPDCRDVFIKAAEEAINKALYIDANELTIITPLMHLTKKESVLLASETPRCMEMLAYSHTCYKGKRPPCGHCHACLLRARGFEQAGIKDPLTL